MFTEENLQKALDENAHGLRLLRSYFQQMNNGSIWPRDFTKDFVDQVGIFRKEGPLCRTSGDDLIIIFDPNYYLTAHQTLYAPGIGYLPPVFFGHGHLPKGLKFDGISGARYPMDIDGAHIDFVEMDSSEYFDRGAEWQERIMRFYADNFPYKDFEDYKEHMSSMNEWQIVFGIRTPESYRIKRSLKLK